MICASGGSGPEQQLHLVAELKRRRSLRRRSLAVPSEKKPAARREEDIAAQVEQSLGGTELGRVAQTFILVLCAYFMRQRHQRRVRT